MKKSRGFSGVEAFLILLIVVIIGVLGYVFLNNTSTNKTQSNASANSVPTAAIDIKSTSDIDKVSSDLNSLNVESDTSSDLDSITTQLNSF